MAMLGESQTEVVYPLEVMERGEFADVPNPISRSRVGYVETAISWGAGCLVTLNVVLVALALV
jgi:hypothetical protein